MIVTGMGLSHQLRTKERAHSQQTVYIQLLHLNDKHKNVNLRHSAVSP